MIAFWIAAALVSAAAAALIVHRAVRAVRVEGAGDPAVAVYRRQLAEIDELSERGLLLDGERRSAHAEAARRLLAAAHAKAAPALTAGGGRVAVTVVAGLAPLVAIAVYMAIGSPHSPDQPFARRLEDWRRADPATLTPDQMAAVMQLIARQRPNDPTAYFYLSRAQLADGDAFSAIQSLQTAIGLAPQRTELWTTLGETEMAQNQGEITDDARSAFRRALSLDPTAPAPRYYLARAQIAGGDVAAGLAAWRALDQSLAANDPRRQELEADIAVVDRTHALPDTTQAAPPGEGQPAFVRAMVAALAARLTAHPDDPAGWARLIRSYSVLGDAPARAAAIAKAREVFKTRPDELNRIEQASGGPQP